MTLLSSLAHSIETLQQEMTAGRLSAVELTAFYLDQIAKKNDQVRAVLEVNPYAIQIAQALDEERADSGVRSILHGIPVLLKDNMDTSDALHTSCGSIAMQHHYATEDAFLVHQLRTAGAIILGKTNMTEWANFVSEQMPNGWSSRGGQVVNPHGPFDVGGSSSGAAVAVACQMTTVAIGTETSGSILNPATQNGLVGIKPTVGAISRSGIIPLSITQDTAGPLARTVSDAMHTFRLMVGKDPKDPITAVADRRFHSVDWSSLLTNKGLQQVRVGVPRTLFDGELTGEQERLFEDVLTQLQACGAIVIDDVDVQMKEADLRFEVLLYECKVALNRYLATSSPTNPIRNLKDLIAFNQQHATETLPYGQKLLEAVDRTSGTLTEKAYLDALQRNRQLTKRLFQEQMQVHHVDVWIHPQDHGCSFSAAGGTPAITVPVSFTKEGEPFCITFCGSAYAEPDLLRYAYALEQHLQA